MIRFLDKQSKEKMDILRAVGAWSSAPTQGLFEAGVFDTSKGVLATKAT